MKIENYTPNERLSPFIKSFLIISSDNGIQNNILPDTSIVMSFRMSGRVRIADGCNIKDVPPSGISGLRKFSRVIHYGKEAATLLVIFREGGAFGFLREPLHEIFGMNVSLDNLMNQNKIRETEEKICEAKTNQQRILIVENFLLSELMEQKQNPLILETLRKIRMAKGNLRIHDLLKGMPISRDSYEKKFRDMIGTSPKHFAGIIRQRNFIETYSPTTTLTDAAYRAGYFDQAHFIKDFKSFTGQTPRDFFKSSSYW